MASTQERPFIRDVEWASGRLKNAVDLLRLRGIDVPERGRVDEALNVLAAFGHRADPPEGQEDRRRIASATRLAIDLGDVAAMLPVVVSDEEREALRHVLRGTLDQEVPNELEDSERPAYSAQSQLMVGALLRAGALPTRVPPDQSKKNPDYLVEVGTMAYGIEVKRARNANSARRAFRSAATQLREEGVRGLVIIDISDCLSPDDVYQVAGDLATDLTALVDPVFEQLLTRLERSAFDVDEGTHRQWYEPVMGVGLFLRGVKWTPGEAGSLQVYGQFDGANYATPPGSLADWHGRDIADAIKRGMDVLNAPVERRE